MYIYVRNPAETVCVCVCVCVCVLIEVVRQRLCVCVCVQDYENSGRGVLSTTPEKKEKITFVSQPQPKPPA